SKRSSQVLAKVASRYGFGGMFQVRPAFVGGCAYHFYGLRTYNSRFQADFNFSSIIGYYGHFLRNRLVTNARYPQRVLAGRDICKFIMPIGMCCNRSASLLEVEIGKADGFAGLAVCDNAGERAG